MPTTFSSRSAVVGFKRQTAEGTPAATPAFEIPMGGGLVGPERAVEELPWTFDSQDSAGHYVSRTSGLIDVTVPVLPRSCVSVLQAVLGARTTSGAGPYTHVLTPADTLPFFTWFFAQPGGNYWTLADSKVGSFALNWSAGSPLELSLSGGGKTATRAAAKWGAATVVEGVDPFFTYIGADMRFDVGATPAVTQVRNIGAGSVSVNRNLEMIQTDRIGWEYMAEQNRSMEVSLDNVVFENNDVINTIFTGSTTGTTLSGATVYGSFKATFIGSDQVAAATRSLVIELPSVLWAIDRIPAADPGGGVTRYTVTGSVKKPTSGATITVTCVNSDSGTNY